jgi:hypothetical protein
MGLGKTYSTQYLLDSNNSSGVAGQVLSTTSTGIDWADANTLPGAGLWLESGNNIYNSNSSNVGIGITSANAKLEVQGPNITSGTPVDLKKFNAITTSLATSAYYGGFAQFWVGRYANTSNHSKTSLVISLNDGLYNSSTSNADTDVMTLLASGNVGIGTTGPDSKLHVLQSGNGTSSLIITEDNARKIKIGRDSIQCTDLSDSGTNLYLNQAGGNVSIPTASLAIGATSPLGGLRVNGGTGDTVSQEPTISLTRTSSTGNVLVGKMIVTTKPSDPTNHGNLVFQVKTTASSGESSAYYTNAITIDGNSANVGIGTASPGEKLHVLGKVLLNNGSSLYIDTTASQTVFANIANIPMRFQTNSANRLTIGGAGAIQFNNYDSTNNTGTPTYILGTDASGNVVKVLGGDIPGGGGTVTGTGVTGEVAYWTSSTNIANNAGMSFSNQQVQFDGIGGGDGFALPYDENPGYSNMSAGGFGILFRETRDNYITGNAYWYKTGGTAGWRAKYSAYAATMIGSDGGNITFETAPANTTAPHTLTFSPRMVIKEGGNVGIGTTAPTAPLHVIGTVRMGNTSEGLTFTAGSGIGNIIGVDTDFAGYNAIALKASANTGIYLDTADNVGIGTTSPGQKLDVSGNIASNSIYLYDSTSNDRLVLDLDGSDNLQISTGTSTGSRGITFFTENSEKMRILSGGNVGIGTTLPDSKLDVTGGDITVNTSGTGFMTFKYGAVGSETSRGSITTDGIDLKVNATADLLLLPTGNVGIGTTSPNYALDIEKDTGSLLNLYRPNSSTAAASFLDFSFNTANATEAVYARIRSDVEVNTNSAQGGDLSFHTANSGTVGEVMRLTQEGNVGIGTTNPLDPLNVQSTGASDYAFRIFRSTSTTQGLAGFYEGSANQGQLYLLKGDNTAGVFLNSDGDSYLTGGNVGIGVTGPTEKLEVAGNIQASGATFQGTINSIIALKTSGAALRANIIGDATGLKLGVFGTKSIKFEWDAVTKIEMKSTGEGIFAGKVSINNASSRDSILNIVDDGTNGDIAFENDSGDVVGIITSIADELNIRVGDGISMSDSIRLRLTDGGNLVIAGTLTQNSDVRLKENIKPIESALDKVKQMQGVEFNKINSSTKEIGVVAQEIENIIPELVLADKEGLKSVAYGNITAVLIEAIKEQQKQIEELKQQLNK